MLLTSGITQNIWDHEAVEAVVMVYGIIVIENGRMGSFQMIDHVACYIDPCFLWGVIIKGISPLMLNTKLRDVPRPTFIRDFVMEPNFTATLKSTKHLASNIRQLCFVCDDGGLINYIPGQFFKLGFDYQGNYLQRSYSIANCDEDPSDNKELLIAIAAVQEGKASQFFFHADPGCTVDVYGPYGMLLLPDTLPTRLILVATGTGVAPFRSMLPQLAKELVITNTSVHLLFGTRNHQELIYADDFRRFADVHTTFHFKACLSREVAQQSDEIHGHVQDALKLLQPNSATDHLMLCGNPNMVETLFTDLRQQGFGVKQVRQEKYVFAFR